MATGQEIATAYVAVVPTTKGIKGKLSKEFDAAGDAAGKSSGAKSAVSFGKSFLKVGAAAIAAVGAAAVAGAGVLVKGVLKEYGELEQNIGGSEAVFGKFAEAAQTAGADAYKNMGLSQSNYLATVNKMGSLMQGAGIKQSKAFDLSSAAMQRAADVASVMGVDTTDAMESIAGAAKGNFTMMDNLGVAMNATTLEAYALEKGMNFDWKTASNAEKTELAMKMFMDRTSQYAGNFAKESEDTLSGSIGMVSASFQNLLAGFGDANANMPELAKSFASSISGVINNVIPVIKNIAASLPGAFNEIFPALQKLFPVIADSFVQMLPMIVEVISQIVMGIVGALPTLLPVLIGALMDAAVAIIGALVTALPQIAAALVGVVPGIINDLCQATIEMLPVIVESLMEVLPMIIDGISQIVLAIIDALPTILPLLITSFIEVAIAVMTALVTALPQIITALIDAIPQIITAIGQALIDSWPVIQPALIELGLLALEALKSLGLLILEGLSNLGLLILDQLLKFPKMIWDFIKTGFTALVTKMINNFTKIVTFFKTLPGKLATAAKQIPIKILNGVIALNQIGYKLLKMIWGGVSNKLSWLWGKVSDFAKQIPTKITQGIGTLLSIGKNLVEGIWNGINNAKDWVLEKIRGFGKAVVDVIKNIFGIKSPSTVMRDEVGIYLAQGIAEGITGGSSLVQAAMDDITASSINTGLNISSTIDHNFSPANDFERAAAIIVRRIDEIMRSYKMEVNGREFGRIVAEVAPA